MNVADRQLLQILPSLGTYRSVLCLNSRLPSPELIRSFHLPIIATDGASVTLQEMGITPSVVIGDGDSLGTATPSQGSIWIQNRDQNFSDFEKAIQFLRAYRLFPAVVLGIGGGYIDHVLYNIELLSQIVCVGYDAPNLLLGLTGTRRLSFPQNTKISFFGVPEAVISTHGLKWELEYYLLRFPTHSSCFNRSCCRDLEFKVHSGRALLVVYLENIDDAGSVDASLL
ncbi:MAG: thiamine diphosphokinase [Verrucomicrobiota bacterium]|nr:MAG: thiamine diphosphokinase [Verrucomicrobiota bacterium]